MNKAMCLCQTDLRRTSVRYAKAAGFTLLEVLIALTIISVGGLAVMKYAAQTQNMTADITHLDTMSRLAVIQLNELEKDGFSSSLSREGAFDDFPGYVWIAKSSLLASGGWYRMALTVKRTDTGRSVILERVFRERL